MKLFSFLGRQLLALVTAVLGGYLSGQVLAVLIPLLFNWLPLSGMAHNGLLLKMIFWLIPFVISLLLAILISLLFGRRRKQVSG